MNMSQAEKGEYKRLSVDEKEDGGYYNVDPVKPPKASFGWRKCLIYTFLVLTGIFLLTVTGAFLFIRSQVRRFTVPAGSEGITTFPSQPVKQAELEVALDQGKLFWDTLRAGQTPADLIVTQDILNGFIAQDDYANTRVAVDIKEDSITVSASLPVDMLPGGRGRYFVSDAVVETKTTEDGASTMVSGSFSTPYPVRKLNFATLLQTSMVAHRDMDGKSSLQMTYGQLLNAVVPREWLDEHKDLLTCDWECDHHHRHHDHHGRKLHRHHDHHHHHHDDDDRQECEEIMTMVHRLSISIVDGAIVVHANEDAESNRRLSSSTTNLSDSIFSKRRWLRRALRAAF